MLAPANRLAWVRRAPTFTAARLQSSAPQSQHGGDKPPSATRQSITKYNNLRKPWLRVFLGAFFTYQILYWSWEKMRTDEIVEQREGEVRALEQDLEPYKKSKDTKAGVA